MPHPALPARWFDGRSSRARPVWVSLHRSPHGPRLQLHPRDADHAAAGAAGRTAPPLLTLHHADVDWPAPWGSRQHPPSLSVGLRWAGTLEIADASAWYAAQADSGLRPSLAQRMQTHARTLLAVLMLAGLLIGLFYRYGTPWLAAQLSQHIPRAWEQALSTEVLAQIDGTLLQPSHLSAERQAELRARFAELQRQIPPQLHRTPGDQPPLQLLFRSGLPPNALALPGGPVIITDAMVQLAQTKGLSDDALLGVLAHEVGHVLYRHGTRLIVEQGVLHIGLGLALGDVSGLLSTGSTLLTGLAYQRQHEREADCFALHLLQATHRPSAPMADLLLASEPQGHAPPTPPTHPHEPSQAALRLLSTHPATTERAQWLRDGLGAQCPL